MNYKTQKGSKHKLFGFSGVHNNTPNMNYQNEGINPTVDFVELLNGMPQMVLKDFIPIMSSNEEDFGIAKLAQSPFSGREAYLAFDGNNETAACGPTSGTGISLQYKSKINKCIPKKFTLGLMYSGMKLEIYGINGNNKTKLLVKDFEVGEIPSNDTVEVVLTSTETNSYEGFEFDVTGGSSTNTPQIAYAQVRGMVG